MNTYTIKIEQDGWQVVFKGKIDKFDYTQQTTRPNIEDRLMKPPGMPVVNRKITIECLDTPRIIATRSKPINSKGSN